MLKIKDDYKRPIKTRKDEEIIEIVSFPEKWSPKAVELAKLEFENRKLDPKKIQTAQYLDKKRKKIEVKKKADEGFTLWDFIDDPFMTLFILIFSWELKKDGYLKKAKQQKYFRIFFVIVILLVILKNQVK
jgi:hypothetical protein